MYDRFKAVEYARQWWNKRNSQFYNFDDLGGDCTNFISQCLFYGGYEMLYSPNGWFYQNLSYRSPSFTGVNEFYNFCIKNKNNNAVKSIICSLDEVSKGDVIQIRQNSSRFTHSLLVTNVLSSSGNIKDNILVATHTIDCFDRKLSDYYILEYRCLKMI